MLKLLVQVGGSDAVFGDAGVFDDGERLGLYDGSDCHAYGIFTGHGDRAVGALRAAETDPRSGITQIPGEAMQAGGFVETSGTAPCAEGILFVIVTRRFRALFDFGSAARESAHRFASRIQNVEGDLAIWRGRQEIVEHRAAAGILHTRARCESASASPLRRPDGVSRGKQCRLGGVGVLFKRRQIVENPKRAALRGEHQIFVRDFDVGDGSGGQVHLKWLPQSSVIERNVHAKFGSGVQQAGAIGVFADHASGFVGRNSLDDSRPGFAEIIRSI